MGTSTEITTTPTTAAATANSRRPLGLRFIERATKTPLTFRSHQAIVLLITFLAYASYHAARKTTSIVKSTLDPRSSSFNLYFTPSPWSSHARNRTPNGGWAPFNGPDGTSMLGEIDLAFLSTYSLGMFFAGHMGDRLDLRLVF